MKVDLQTKKDELLKQAGPIIQKAQQNIFVESFINFNRHNGQDVSAALSFYMMSSFFPLALALLSLLNLIGFSQAFLEMVVPIAESSLPQEIVDLILMPAHQMLEFDYANIVLIVGILVMIWTGTRYVSAFGRAMDRILEEESSLPNFLDRFRIMIITIALIAILVITTILVTLSKDLLLFLASLFDISSQLISFWPMLRWPFLILFIIALLALLYFATPSANFKKRITGKERRKHSFFPGAILSVIGFAVLIVGFRIYAQASTNLDLIYGTLAGIIILLLFFWLMNVIILFGAEFNVQVSKRKKRTKN